MDSNNNQTKNKTNKIISTYKEKSDEIIRKMSQILIKAKNKVDNAEYVRLLGKIKNKIT